MSIIGRIEQWLSPLKDPLGEFRTQVADLVNVHTDSVATFQRLSSSLVATGVDSEAFSGTGSEQFWEIVQEYLNAERLLDGGIGDVGVLSETLEDGANASETCVEALSEAAQEATTEAEDQGALDELTASVDEVDVATAGTVPPADILGIILTVITVVALIGTITQLLWSVYNAVQNWHQAMYMAGSKDLPPLPKKPGQVKSNLKPAPPVKIYLNKEQEEKVNSIMNALARAGIIGISREDIEKLVASGFDEGSILAAIIGWHNAGWSASRINFALEDAAYNVINTIPYGMNTPGDLRAFISSIQKGLAEAGYPCVSTSIGGSAVTGKKYTTGAPFDVGRTSDYDVAIADPTLLEKAKKMGISLRGAGTRTGPLSDNDLKRLGLYNLIGQLSAMSKRDVHFMIYNSVVTASQRAPTILISTGSCS
jgi:hypothetical protein